MKRLAVLIAAVMVLSGCVPHTELDKLGIAEAVGIDYDGELYTVTVQYFNTDASGGVTAVDSSAPNVVTEHASGGTIESALEALSYKTGKDIMLGAVSLIVFGRDAAFSLRDSLGFTASHYSGNFRSYMAVADGKASDIMGVKFTEGNASVDKLEGMIRNAQELGLSRPVRLYEAAEALCGPTESLVMPLMTSYSGGSELTDDGSGVILSGGALCTDGQYAGKLTVREMSGLQLLDPCSDSTGTCEMSLKVGGSETRVMLYRTHADITPSLKAGELHLDIALTADCKYVSTNIGDPYAAKTEIEEICAAEAAARVSELLEKALHRYGADVMGLEYRIRSHSPDLWRLIEPDYRSALLSSTYNITSSAHMERFGITRTARDAEESAERA